MFTHSGYPNSWQPKNYCLYALFDPRNDCFVYVNHDVTVVRTVQALLSSKAPTWIYELWIPSKEMPTLIITNKNCETWTLPPTVRHPEITFFQINHEEIISVDCTEINVLGQMAGLDFKTNITEESKTLKDYAVMVGWFCQQLRTAESISDQLISRVAIVDKVYLKTDIFDNDAYLFVSEIYKILMLSLTIDEVKQKIIAIGPKIDSMVLVNKYARYKFEFLQTLIAQWTSNS